MWKIIPNTNNCYSANDETGEIKSNDRRGLDERKLKGKILKPFMQNSGYLVVDLMINGKKIKKLVHRLVAKTFISKSNLECITRAENLKYAKLHGLIIPSEKQLHQRRVIGRIGRETGAKAIAMFDKNGKLLETFEALADAKHKYGYDKSAISRAARGMQKTAYGYFWKWVES